MIIGLTGRNAAGKTTAGRWLAGRLGCGMDSLSDAIRYWLTDRGREITRETLIDGGRQLRREGGPGVLAERLLARVPEGADYVIDSVRSPAEVAALRARPGFVLLALDAPLALRFERLLARGRAGDALTLEDFQRQEAAELTSDDPAGQALLACEALADRRLVNDGSLADLERALAELLSGVGR
jgi:dephospho-CoA kinase